MYPTYARSERVADGTMHAVGVVLAITAASAVLIWAAGRLDDGQMIALAIYAVGLIATFVASAFYHMTPWENLRPTLRRIDHAMIYLKIAGTFTPLVVIVASPLAYSVLTIVWILAAFGMVQKLFFWQTPGRFGPALYLAMGWLGVFLLWEIIPLVPSVATALMATGGALYTIGVIFYSWESLKFSIAIWHGFVVAASACFFSAIVMVLGHAA